MRYDCKFMDECRLPYDLCDEKCKLFKKVEHDHKTCKNPRHCQLCEDEGYGDYLLGQERDRE